jgi:hypothetical protein
MANLLYFDIFCLQENLAQVFKENFLAALRAKDSSLFFNEKLETALSGYFKNNPEPLY